MHATRLKGAAGNAHRWPVPRHGHRLGWLTLLVVTLGCGTGSAPQEASKEMPPAPVAVAAVQQREVTVEQTYVGTVTPLRISTVSSPVDGLVVEFLVNEGDYVEGVSQRELLRNRESAEPSEGPKALPLARLRTESLVIEIAAAKAELKVREAELSELRASHPKEIEQAKAQMVAAEAAKDLTQSRLKRTRELYGRSVTSPDELEEQESAAEEAANVYLERRAAWELLVKTDYWEEKIKQAEARVQVQRDTINGLEDDLRQHAIYAPFDGYVTKEHAEVGEWVAKGSPIAEVVELDHVDVEVPVLESYVTQLRQPSLLFRFEPNAVGDFQGGALLDALRERFAAHGLALSEEAVLAPEEEGPTPWPNGKRGKCIGPARPHGSRSGRFPGASSMARSWRSCPRPTSAPGASRSRYG
jgi:multidrug resistance efflux pump